MIVALSVVAVGVLALGLSSATHLPRPPSDIRPVMGAVRAVLFVSCGMGLGLAWSLHRSLRHLKPRVVIVLVSSAVACGYAAVLLSIVLR